LKGALTTIYLNIGGMMRSILIIFLMGYSLFSNESVAESLIDNTQACRMEVKILGPDALEEDENCLWLEENKAHVLATCKQCLNDLELIKEASQGYFDY
jgi:ornithine carbamoyltransferase